VLAREAGLVLAPRLPPLLANRIRKTKRERALRKRGQPRNGKREMEMR
jgi:hypothetical protein